MNKIFLFICFLFLSILINAQAPVKFYCRYGGNGYDIGNDVKQTHDKGYIITGSTSSFGQGNTDLYLLKIDSLGHKVFEKTFGGYNNETGKSVVQLIDSSFVMVGYTSSIGFGGYDVFLVKADKNGNLVWQKTIGGSDWDFANSLAATADGGFIIGGTTYSFGYGNADGYIIKTDGAGNIVWTKTYGGKKDDEFKSIIQTSDLNYAIVGNTKSYVDSLGDGWLFKVNALGDSIHSASYGGLFNDSFNNVVELSNTDLYVVGANKSFKNGANYVNWLFLLNSSNSILQNTFVGNTNNERYNSSAVGLNGTIVSVGYNNYLGTLSDANVHFYTPGLGYLAFFPFGLENTDELFSVSKTKDKGFVAVGTCIGNTSILNDVLFVKMDSLGNYGSSIIGINELPEESLILKVFPNPSIDYFEINIGNIYDNHKLIYSLFDLNGKLVLKDKILNEKTLIHTSDLDQGLYILQLSIDRKIIFNSKVSIIK